MDKNILIQSHESKLQYLRRLVDGYINGHYMIKYPDIIKLVFDVDLSHDESRKRFYGIKMVLNLIDESEVSNLSGEEILEKIEEKREKLERERIRVQTEKVEWRRFKREDVRSAMFEQKVLDRIEKFVEIVPPKYSIDDSRRDKELVLNLADIHYGKEVNITDFLGKELNLYNIEAFEARMWKLLEETLEVARKEDVDHIQIINLSDSIDGILRMSQLQSLRVGIIDAVIGFSEFMAVWLNELSKYVRIDYRAVQGNHNEIRPLGSSSGDFPHENTERLITWYLKKALDSNPNVVIHECLNHQYLDILGVKILATHGQNDKKLENSIKDYMMTYGNKVDLLLTGHLHTTHTKTIGTNGSLNVEYVQCPSICGIDEYSVKLKKSAKAGALLFTIEKDRGKRTTYDIKLN